MPSEGSRRKGASECGGALDGRAGVERRLAAKRWAEVWRVAMRGRRARE